MATNKLYKFSGLIILAIFFSSCTSSFKTVYIEVAKPSEYMLPNDVVSLTLMNRGISGEFNNYPADSLQGYFYRKAFDVSAAVLDSVAADTTLKVLGQLLYESGRYEVVIPEERNIRREEAYFKVPLQLDWDYVAEICNKYETDALLVIERYINKIITNYDKVSYSDLHFASIDSKYDAVARIYDPAKKEVIKQIIVADTIYWAEEDYSQQGLFTRKLVPVKQALIETGIQVALDMDAKLSPQWITERRGYFSVKDANSKLLESYIKANDWQKAHDYWQGLYAETDSKSIKSKLEYNLAIASEMLGNINEAAEWAKKSYTTQYRRQTDAYFYQLKKRKKMIDEFEKFSD
jgi:hypothetical protein